MSALTHPKFDVSAHADYRRSDYMFSRAQSRALSQREWEHPTPALRSWGNVLIPAVTAAAAMTVALAAFY
jgi:sarcosine oxidase delta subunit